MVGVGTRKELTMVPTKLVVLAMGVVAVLVVNVKGQSGPVTTETTNVGLGEDYVYDDTVTPPNTQTGNPGVEYENPGINNKTNPVMAVPKPSSPPSATQEGARETQRQRGKVQHAGEGLFYPLYGEAGKMNPNPGGVMNTGPAPISEDYWDSNSYRPHQGIIPPPHRGIFPPPNAGFPRMRGGNYEGRPPMSWRPPMGDGNGAWRNGYAMGGGRRGGGVPFPWRGGDRFNGGYYPYGEEFEQDEGYWYNGTFYYGPERDGELYEDGGGYWYNGTYYYSYFGEGDEREMEDGYWYNGTFYYGGEMEWDGMGEMYEDGYWYNGTFHYVPEYDEGYWYNGTFYYLPDYEDGYWYNGTFHYVPEYDDGYWYNGTFHYLPEYDEGYWYNGTFYYRPEMEMEGAEDGFYYNGTFYPGEMEAEGYGGYGEREEMEEENLMWWQRHHPRWEDRTNDALGQPGPTSFGTGVGNVWSKYIPGLQRNPFPGPYNQGPLPIHPNTQGMALHQPQLAPTHPFMNSQLGKASPFLGFLGFPQGRQLPRPPITQQPGKNQRENTKTHNKPTDPKTPSNSEGTHPIFQAQYQRQAFQQRQGVQPPAFNQRRPPPLPNPNNNNNNDNNNPSSKMNTRPQQNARPYQPGRSRIRRPPPKQGYIERNPMRSAMVDNNNNDRNSKILGALGMGGLAAGSSLGRMKGSQRRRPPIPEGARYVRRRRPQPPPPGTRGSNPRGSNPRGFEGKRRRIYTRRRGHVTANKKYGNIQTGSRVAGKPGVGVGNTGGLSPSQPDAATNIAKTPNQDGTVVTKAQKMAIGGNNNNYNINNKPDPSITRKKANSPLDPYRSSPATTLGILFASILGFLLILSPLACLLRKYRQTKRDKKRTFLRRPELGSVDEGIMDAMIRTELGVVKCSDDKGGARVKEGKRSRRHGSEMDIDIVKMEEIIRPGGKKSRFKGFGKSGKKDGKDKKELRNERKVVRGIEVKGLCYDEGGNSRGASVSTDFSRRHEEMRRMVRGLPTRYEEGEVEEERWGAARRMVREERKVVSRPHTVVGLVSENEDVEIV